MTTPTARPAAPAPSLARVEVLLADALRPSYVTDARAELARVREALRAWAAANIEARPEDEVCWLVERSVGGQTVWLKWRGLHTKRWTTDAAQADRYDAPLPAARDARALSASGLPSMAVEHMFIRGPGSDGGMAALRALIDGAPSGSGEDA